MSIDARTEKFEHIELFGKPALFTNGRIDRNTVPKGWYCYDFRGSDYDPGKLNSVELHVGVNHSGAVLLPEKLDMKGKDYRQVRGQINFLGEDLTIREFCKVHGLECTVKEPEFHIAHDGNVWTIIYSLHREDAERLGYNNADAWRKLLISQQAKFADAFHVPLSELHWYAAYHDADTHPHIHMMVWTDQKSVLKRDAVIKLRSAMTNQIFQTELENLYAQKDIAYKDIMEASREAMRQVVDRLEHISEPPEVMQEKLLDLALELQSVSGKKQYGYLKKPLKDQVDAIADELEKLPEVAEYYAIWNGLRDTLEGYYKSAPRQHHPLSQQKEFRAIKNAIVQEAELLRLQLEQNEVQACTDNLICNEETASVSDEKKHLQSEILLTSTVRLFHQMSQIFRDNAAAPSNPMGIRADSKRRKKLLQKRLAMGHKQDDHEIIQNYGQSIS